MRQNVKRAAWVMAFCLLALFAGSLPRLLQFPSSIYMKNTTVPEQQEDYSTRKSLSFVLEERHDPQNELNPKLVWLASFPNSGTSYTMMSVLRASNYSTATNYGDEVTAEGDLSLPVYPDRPEGPYWLGLSGKLGQPRPLPDNYILVKTHCGSRCIKCGPVEYVQTVEEFVDDCRRASARVGPSTKKLKLDYYYPTDRVHKVIHLVRHPIHNMVARFHLDSKNYNYKGRDKWLEAHPNDQTGFRKWCSEMDARYQGEDSVVFSRTFLPVLKTTPCHAEIFRYIQWHNHAFVMTEKLGIPSMVVHYEDYETKYDETFRKILEFLELPWAAEQTKEFSARHDYDDYFRSNETERIKTTARMLASNATWNAIQRYF
jgi:hypothetical protein